MTATERASGRAHAEAEELTAKMQEAGGAVSERVHEAQVGGTGVGWCGGVIKGLRTLVLVRGMRVWWCVGRRGDASANDYA